MAVELIGPCDVAGVCGLRPGRGDTCAHTHTSLQLMDDLQHGLGEGPAMSRHRTMDVVSVPTSSRMRRGRAGGRTWPSRPGSGPTSGSGCSSTPSRKLIGEATGMLRERFTLTSEQAFAVLKRLSSQQNVKLFAVAQHVVDTGTPPGGDDRPPAGRPGPATASRVAGA